MNQARLLEIKRQIDRLDEEYRSLQKKSRHDDLSDLAEESNVIVTRLRATLDRLQPVGSSYRQEFEFVADQPVHVRIPVYIGVLRALRADIDDGWLTSVVQLVHAETYDDLLDQAEELRSKGYKDAAAVVAGSALEVHIRVLCGAHGVAVQQAPGKPKKADVMNADLVKAGAYNVLQQKSITSWLAVRNSSAHGQYTDYDGAQVANMMQGIRDFVVRHPG